jgi:FkbH-like protein
MKLLEALKINQTGADGSAEPLRIGLVCGFTPLHLQTFLAAHLQVVSGGKRFEIVPGLYGDIWGNFERSAAADVGTVIVQLEWSDLDARLGLRGLGSWSPDSFVDILSTFKASALRVNKAVERLRERGPVVISLPTLPLPPVSHATGWEASALELEIQASVHSMALAVGGMQDVRVASLQRLDRISPPNERHDPKSELEFGFPYTLAHSSALAEALAHLVHRPIPRKGLITDLDETLWKGIVGEDGVGNISWDLEHSSHLHGVYQRFLHALSGAGVLIAAASRNDIGNVDEAFRREDMILPRRALFPIEANWDAKSESVRRILQTWNVGADSVVFIDDSPIELAEVKAAHPQMECILFPSDDARALDDLMRHLRDLFGKSALSEEDGFRLDSIRQAHRFRDAPANDGGTSVDFLRRAEAQITFHFAHDLADARALELVNKTNQFNLNGRRYSEVEWARFLGRPDAFLMVAGYRDKYGPLGKIAVLAGHEEGKELIVDTWVMSCRAFGRRIEYRCLQELFRRWKVEQVVFKYQDTSKNGPMAAFLSKILGAGATPDCRLHRDQFAIQNEGAVHQVVEVSNG